MSFSLLDDFGTLHSILPFPSTEAARFIPPLAAANRNIPGIADIILQKKSWVETPEPRFFLD
jgi:hypothetical protein